MSDEEIYQKRDLILQKLLDNSEHMKEKFDDHLDIFDKHVQDDKDFQKEIKDQMGWGLKIAVIVLIIVAANGGAEAIKMLFKIGGGN